ncbi:MAG TPA: CDP-alcohol phosphatidyltransferase family protein [Gammaproteobacteria bacterium]|nr:CDP-alcohol phosphatidyltransferase family protein [Gammaproteobacteria bacterium]
MNGRWLPNAISIARIALVIPVAWSIIHGEDQAAFTLIIIAALSDALDGLLAKSFGWTTDLGTILDPIADKVFMAGSFIAAVWAGLIPLWITVIVIARDAIIVTGALIYRWHVGDFKPQPSVLSKVNTFLQLLLVLAVVARHYTIYLPKGTVLALVVAVVITTLGSGMDYFIRWGRRLARAPRRRPA